MYYLDKDKMRVEEKELFRLGQIVTPPRFLSAFYLIKIPMKKHFRISKEAIFLKMQMCFDVKSPLQEQSGKTILLLF